MDIRIPRKLKKLEVKGKFFNKKKKKKFLRLLSVKYKLRRKKKNNPPLNFTFNKAKVQFDRREECTITVFK